MRPALVLIAAALALFLLVKGVPYLLVQAESLATSVVFSHAWDRARGLDALPGRDSSSDQAAAEAETPWRLTAARPVAKLSAPRLNRAAVIVDPDGQGRPGFADFLLMAPALSKPGAWIPSPDEVRAGTATLPLPGTTGTVHAHGVNDKIIVDSAGRSLRFLPDLRPGDLLELESVDGRVYQYQVSGARVALSLQPDHMTNADLIKGLPELTLIAPYPLNDLSPSAFRYKVRANFVDFVER